MDARAHEAGWAHEASTESGYDSVHGAQVRRSLSRAIENQQLMFDQERFCDDGSDAARSQQFSNRHHEMDE